VEEKTEKMMWTTSIFSWVIAISMSGTLMSGLCAPQARGDDGKPDLKMTAPGMFAAYDGNAIAADAKFKGKTIEVSGVVQSIGKDILSHAYIGLSGGGDFHIMVVQCYLDDAALPAAAEVQKGQSLRLIGKFDSKFGNILLKKCEILK
jgi:hypothetical protein